MEHNHPGMPPASVTAREFMGKRYSYNAVASVPYLEIEGQGIPVERMADGMFMSHHKLFMPYHSLEKMAEDLILFDPDFKDVVPTEGQP